MGATYKDDPGYAVQYADVIAQSYHPVKHITTGEGGAVITNNSEIDAEVRLLRTHGMTKDNALLENNEGPWYYEMIKLGYNYRITDIQCALGISQLKKLDNFIKRRQEIARMYNDLLSNHELFIVPKVSKNVAHAYHLYPLQVKFDEYKLRLKYKIFDSSNPWITLGRNLIFQATQESGWLKRKFIERAAGIT